MLTLLFYDCSLINPTLVASLCALRGLAFKVDSSNPLFALVCVAVVPPSICDGILPGSLPLPMSGLRGPCQGRGGGEEAILEMRFSSGR